MERTSDIQKPFQTKAPVATTRSQKSTAKSHSHLCSKSFVNKITFYKKDPVLRLFVGQIGVKTNHNTAFCDQELKCGMVTEDATKSKTGHRANIINRDYVIQGDFNVFSFSLAMK